MAFSADGIWPSDLPLGVVGPAGPTYSIKAGLAASARTASGSKTVTAASGGTTYSKVGGGVATAAASGVKVFTAAPVGGATIAANNFEGGTGGTTITVGNSGGTSGDAWDVVSGPAAGHTLAFDSTIKAHGGLAAKVQTGGTFGAGADLEWTTKVGSRTSLYGRFYFYATANPANVKRIATLATAGGAALVAGIELNTNGTIQITDSPGTPVLTTAAIALNAWNRVEFHVVASATVGQVELRLFTTTPDGTTADSNLSSAANKNTSAGPIAVFAIGQQYLGKINTGPHYYDDVGIATADWIGPVIPATTSTKAGLGAGTGAARGAKTFTPAPAVATKAGTAAGASAASGTRVTTTLLNTISVKTGLALVRWPWAQGAKFVTRTAATKTGLAASARTASGARQFERRKTGLAASARAASGSKTRQGTLLLDVVQPTLVLPPIDFARLVPLPVLTLTPTIPPLSTTAKTVPLDVLTLPLTLRSGWMGGRSLGTLRLTLTLPPPTIGYVGGRSRRGIPPAVFRSGIRVMAQTVLDKVWVHRELPVDGLRLSYRLSGANSITGSIGPEHRELAELLTALPPWGTWLHVEEGGMVAASGILMPPSTEEDGTMALTAVGPSAYAARIPYVAEFVGIQVDPIDIVRHLWEHVQSFPRGDLGLEVFGASAVLVGYPADPVAPDANRVGSADKIRAAADIATRIRSGLGTGADWLWAGCPAWVTAAAPGLLSDYNSPTPRGVPYNWLWGYYHGAAAIQPVDKVYAAKAILARFDAGQQINADWTWDGVPAYVITYKADLAREFGDSSKTNAVVVKNWMDGWVDGAGEPPSTPAAAQNPYYIHGYELPAIGGIISQLGTDTPFDYVEECGYEDPITKNVVFHRIRCQAPQIGRRLEQLNFTQGENLFEHGAFEEPDDGYADSAYVKGAGTGPDSIVGYSGIAIEDRLRMPTVVTDQRLVSVASATSRAAEEVAKRLSAVEELPQIAVNVRHINSPWGSFGCGDEILPRVRLPYVGAFAQWHRIVQIDYDPDAGVAALTLTRRSGFGK